MSLLLKIPNVVGEVTTAGFAGAVAADSVSWGHGRLTDPTTGLAQGRILPRLFTFAKRIDRASPSIAALLIGRKAVKLEFFQTQLTGTIVTRAVLLDAVFEDVQVSGHAAGGDATEMVTASYGRITVIYNKLNKDGTVQLVGSYDYTPIV